MNKTTTHNHILYNNLLLLSRNIFFYEKCKLSDTFETRIYLMFFHFSIMLIIYKLKGTKFEQKMYDKFFDQIEYNLRESGFGDVTVNKKMKDLNKIFYDILLKINEGDLNAFKISKKLVFKYFEVLSAKKDNSYLVFETYFTNFYDFCFELPLNNMIRDAINFNKYYGST